jgi:membrane protein DedA with SNARE-associated domain
VSHHLINLVEGYLLILAERLPLGVFVFVGSIFEEIVSPIPPALVVGVAGSLAHLRGLGFLAIMFLAVLGSIGKTIGAAGYYALGDRLEDIVVARFGRFLGVSHSELERVGKRFSGKHWKDGGILLLFRVLPFMPSTVASLAAGIFKMNWRVYLGITLGGYFIKDLYFILLGYMGYAAFRRVMEDIDRYKIVVDMLTIALVTGALLVLYRHRHKGKHAWKIFCRWFDAERNEGN